MEQSTAPATPTWGIWGTLLWSCVVGLLFVVLQTVVVVVGLFTMDFKGGIEESLLKAAANGTLLSIATLLTMLAGPAAIVGAVKAKSGAVLPEYLALRSVPFATHARWLGTIVLFLLASELLAWAVGHQGAVEVMIEYYRSAKPVWLFWFAVVVGAALFEELLFRGFMFKGLRASRLGLTGAIVLPAILWALIHVQYPAYEMTQIFVFGLLLGVARERTGSVLVPIGMHALNNLISVVQLALIS
jgi:uncharacterized protein